MRRRSDELKKRLENMPVQDKGRAIVLAAARNGKSQQDLVRIIVNDIARVTKPEQAKEIADIWGPLIELKPERFAEIAEEVLKKKAAEIRQSQ